MHLYLTVCVYIAQKLDFPIFAFHIIRKLKTLDILACLSLYPSIEMPDRSSTRWLKIHCLPAFFVVKGLKKIHTCQSFY